MVELKEDIVVLKRMGRKFVESRRFKTVKEAVEFMHYLYRTGIPLGAFGFGWRLSDIYLMWEYLESMETDFYNYPHKTEDRMRSPYRYKITKDGIIERDKPLYKIS